MIHWWANFFRKWRVTHFVPVPEPANLLHDPLSWFRLLRIAICLFGCKQHWKNI